MYIASILAGGHGSRMNNVLPKQFMDLKNKPVVIWTIEQFLKHQEIKYVVVAVDPEYVEHTNKIIEKHLKKEDVKRIIISSNGKTRMTSLIASVKKVEEVVSTLDFTLLSHDSSRPLVTSRIIKDHLVASKNKATVNTAIKSVDTIIETLDAKTVSSTTVRKNMYQVQTPQTFNAQEFMNLIDTTDSSKQTDACGMFVDAGIEVKIVEGSRRNIKLTTPEDMPLLEALMDMKG